MTEVTGVLHGIPLPENQWVHTKRDLGVLEALVARSRLLGADRSLANQGGGNTSAKGVVADHVGREQRVLWVKGSGTDLASITDKGFAALRLDEILALRERDAVDDAAMVDYLLRCALAPNQPRPSIETLLHAFIPAAHIGATNTWDSDHPHLSRAIASGDQLRRMAAGPWELASHGLHHVDLRTCERSRRRQNEHRRNYCEWTPGQFPHLRERRPGCFDGRVVAQNCPLETL